MLVNAVYSKLANCVVTLLYQFQSSNAAMGATLSCRAEWTSASDKGGKLDFSKSNEALLLEILKYVEDLCRDHPREADVIFKRPFAWKTSLSLSNFESLRRGDEYTFSDSSVASVAKEERGDPHLSVTKVGDGLEIRALSFKQLQRVIGCAGDKKLKEVRLCLEANQDPVATIMGPGFASVAGVPGGTNTLLEVHERLARERARDAEGKTGDELDSSFRLMLLINNLDLKMLHSSVKQMGKEVRLSPEAVDTEMELLKQFAGGKDDSCLREIHFTSEVAFSNGCRAPPWRQVLGDICYIKVVPCDGPEFHISASTEGYYVNKGMKASGEVDCEKVGEIYTTLVGLLKAKSKAFSDNIGKQEFVYSELTDAGPTSEMGPAEDVASEMTDAPQLKSQQQERQERTASPAKSTQKKTAITEKKKIPKSTFDVSKGTVQPSQKWKSLGLTDEKFYTAPQSPLKTASSTGKGKPLGSLPSAPKTKSATSTKSKLYGVSRGSTHQSLHETLYDSESSSEASEEEEQQERRPESNADLPSEYWQIQKLIKYLKGGNQTAAVIALCSILDFDLSQEACQLAIRDSNGLDLLINLLETNDIKCKIATLRILREISKNNQTRTAIVDLKGLPILVEILKSPNRGLKCLAGETIANVAKFHRARRIVRQNGGIKKLVNLIVNPGRPGSPITGEQSDEDVARSAALGLWSCSKSRSNKIALLKTGAVPLLGKLLATDNVDVLIPVVGTLQECASEPTYQKLIQSEGMVEHLVRGLKTDNKELQKHCASAIFKCAEEEATRSLVREHEGLEPLAALLKNTEDKDLLCAVTGAVWKCSKSPQNVTKFKSLKAIDQLVSLLSNQPEEVQVNVVGAIGECAAIDAEIRVTIRKAGGVTPLVQLLTGTNQSLLINTTKAVGACALDPESMIVIDKQDGVRLLWSLLKSPNPEVQACAAWAICPCIENAKDAGELVRSFVGGLELIVGLLKSYDHEVLASVCAAIAKIAKDEENLGVITDHGVVPLLATLTNTSDDHLRRHLADAIARCCMWRNNRVAFGEASAVAPLVTYLQSTELAVHRSTACALHQLSKDPDNCITMHEAGVVQPLLHMVGSTDEVLQEAAAGCISNIRHLALSNEREKFK